MDIIGVIGGLGPMATVYFLQLIVQMTYAETDQQHIEVLVHSKPQIPDRTSYILGKSDNNPVPEMINVGKRLVEQGATMLAIPCITAHYFQKELEESISVPIISAIEETADYLSSRGIDKVGLMATDGTVQSGIFQNMLETRGISVVIPTEVCQKKVMHLIYKNVKAGKEMEMNIFQDVSRELFDNGAQVVLLGCTELSIAKRDYCLGKKYLDVMEVLARKAVLACGKLRPEYDKLLD